MLRRCDSPTGLLSLVGSSRVPTAHQLFWRCILSWKPRSINSFLLLPLIFPIAFLRRAVHLSLLLSVWSGFRTSNNYSATLAGVLGGAGSNDVHDILSATLRRRVRKNQPLYVLASVPTNALLSLTPNLCFNAYFASHSHKKVKLKWNHAGMAPQFLWPWLLTIRTRRLMKCVS